MQIWFWRVHDPSITTTTGKEKLGTFLVPYFFKGLGACYALPFPKSSHCGHHIHKPTKLGIILKRSKTLKMPLLSKLRNQKTHSKLEEWTQLIKKIDPFQEIPVQSNKAVLGALH